MVDTKQLPLTVGIAEPMGFARDYEEVIRHYRPNWSTIILSDRVPIPRGLDALVLTGGSDIDPALYGQRLEPRTDVPNIRRDRFEWALVAANPNAFKFGGCRGGQLLHAYNGGVLRQHIDGHRASKHTVVDKVTGRALFVSSYHHQEMSLGSKKAEYFCLAEDGIIEGIFYKHSRSLCVQWHPEWGPEECTEYAFELIDRYY